MIPPMRIADLMRTSSTGLGWGLGLGYRPEVGGRRSGELVYLQINAGFRHALGSGAEIGHFAGDFSEYFCGAVHAFTAEKLPVEAALDHHASRRANCPAKRLDSVSRIYVRALPFGKRRAGELIVSTVPERRGKAVLNDK